MGGVSPGGRGSGDRGGVVDSGAPQRGRSLVAQANGPAKGGKEQGGQYVEEEDYRDGLGDLLIVGSDDRSGGRDGGAAADGGAHPNQCGDVGGHLQQLIEHKGDDEGGGDGGADDGQGFCPYLGDLREIEAEAQQDDRILQDLFGGVGDARLEPGLIGQQQSDDHAGEDAEHRAADDREPLPKQPAGHGHDETHEDAFPVFLNKVHDGSMIPFL